MAQDLFGRHLGRHAQLRSYRCFAPIRFLAVVSILRTKFWQPADHALVQVMAVWVLSPPRSFWREKRALPQRHPAARLPALVFPPAPERRIRHARTTT